MLLNLGRGSIRRTDAVLDAADALRAVQWSGHPNPILLAYHPPADGPYMSLLYGRALELGIAPVPIRTIDDAAALVPIAAIAGGRVVLHLHWLNRVLAGAPDDDDAARRIAAFGSALDRVMNASVAIAWTIHNVLPHATRRRECEAALRREVVARASVVHVMSAATDTLVADQFTINPSQRLHVPMPAFTGLYPDLVDRLTARRVLRLPPDVPTAGMLGALLPYKGLSELLDALPEVERRRPGFRAVIGGSVGQLDEMEPVIDRAAADPRVLIHPRRVPDDQVQHLMRGIDVAVLPYRRVLNSAALLLALAFERRIVIPDDPALAEFADPSLAVTYRRGSAGALADAIDAALDLPTDAAAAAARAISAERDPATLSRAFARGLRDRIGA